MNVVNAVWERRNMGVDCVEITVERGDSPQSCLETVQSSDAEYLVVKIPAGQAETALLLQENGMQYIETMLSFRRGTQLPVLNVSQENLLKHVDYEKIPQDGFQQLFHEIQAGMFQTDRIALDPHFTEEQAHNRYIGWIRDEIERETDFFQLKYKDREVGFFGFKQLREGVYFPFLAGIYPSSRAVFGLGYALCYMEIKEANRRGARTITGSVSTNNVASLASLTTHGYIVDGAMGIYVRHKEKR